MNAKKIAAFLAALIFMSLAASSFLFPTSVSGQAVLPTPTAGPDGKIIYIAEANDSWWIISVKTGVTQEQLYALNNAKADDPITEGQKILIGEVAPNTPTPTIDPNVTPSPTPVTPTPLPGNGNICVVLYNDENGNSVREDTEAAMAEGAVSLIAASGKPSMVGKTVAGDSPLCFNDLPEGSYNVSMAVPQGFNATTIMTSTDELKAGDNLVVNFGAQYTSKAQQATQPSEGGRSPVMALVGGVFLLGAVGLIVYLVKFRK
jgi:hypothetical protein